MQRIPLKNNQRTKNAFIGSVLFFVNACTPSAQKVELDSGQAAFAAKNYKSAVVHFEKVMQKDSKAELSLVVAQKIAEISELNLHDYQKALTTYKFIIVNSSLDYERVEAQKKMANDSKSKSMRRTHAVDPGGVAAISRGLSAAIPPVA